MLNEVAFVVLFTSRFEIVTDVSLALGEWARKNIEPTIVKIKSSEKIVMRM